MAVILENLHNVITLPVIVQFGYILLDSAELHVDDDKKFKIETGSRISI